MQHCRVEDWRSGRRMARYEPFPSSPLKFRTVGFPQSGFKAGLSDRTFLDVALLKPSTRPAQCCSKFDLSFVRSAADVRVQSPSRFCLACAPPCTRPLLPCYSRGPRSGAVLSFPLHHHLSDPMGPTRRHKTISTHSAYMPCLAIAGPCFSRRRLVPRFHHRSLVACRSLRPRRAQPLHISSSFVACAGLRRRATGSALSILAISGLTD